jgi:hypothetical protein
VCGGGGGGGGVGGAHSRSAPRGKVGALRQPMPATVAPARGAAEVRVVGEAMRGLGEGWRR